MRGCGSASARNSAASGLPRGSEIAPAAEAPPTTAICACGAISAGRGERLLTSHHWDSVPLVHVRRFQPGDEERVLPFLALHFPEAPAKSDRRYFEWRFTQCPLGSSLPHYWLAFE